MATTTTTTTTVPVAQVVCDQPTVVIDRELLDHRKRIADAKIEANAKEQRRLSELEAELMRRSANEEVRAKRDAVDREARLKEEVLREQKRFYEEQTNREKAEWRRNNPREAAAIDDQERALKREEEWARTERERVLAIERRATDAQNAEIAERATERSLKMAVGAVAGVALGFFL